MALAEQSHDYRAEPLWMSMCNWGEELHIGGLTVIPEYMAWDDVLDFWGSDRDMTNFQENLETDISQYRLGDYLYFFRVFQTDVDNNIQIIYTDANTAGICRFFGETFGMANMFLRAMPKVLYDKIWDLVCTEIAERDSKLDNIY